MKKMIQYIIIFLFISLILTVIVSCYLTKDKEMYSCSINCRNNKVLSSNDNNFNSPTKPLCGQIYDNPSPYDEYTKEEKEERIKPSLTYKKTDNLCGTERDKIPVPDNMIYNPLYPKSF